MDMTLISRIRFAPWLLSALVAAGCASTHGLAPQGRLFDADALQAQRSLAHAQLSAADFPAQDWWNSLGDPQLDGLIAEALQGTPSLDAADARVRQARSQAALTDAARKPDLSASAQLTSVQLPETLAPAPLGGELNTNGILMLDFKWAPDLWGGQRARYEAAVGQLRAAEIDAQAARLMLSSNIARTYVGLAQAHDAFAVAERDARRNTALLDLARQRLEAGLDNEMQLRQAESGIASARQQEQAAQQQIDALRNALAALLGKGPDRGLEIGAPKLLSAPAPAVPRVMASELLGHRPDVVAARWRVEAAGRGIDATKATFKPAVNLSAIVGVAAPALGDLFRSDALLGFGGPALSLPIFDGERLRADLAKSDADYDLAVANYNQSLTSALREVADAVQSGRSFDTQVASATQAREAAQHAHVLASERYRAGLGTQLDVLATQGPLLRLDQQLAALRAQRYLAAIDLNRALGGGLPLQSPAPSEPHKTASTTP